MNKKKQLDSRGFVYSTDPSFSFEQEPSSIQETLAPSGQKLKLLLDNKHRGGKTVTLVSGFIGKEEDLEQLTRDLKNHCGTGGSCKDGDMIIQGDQREKIKAYLLKKGYGVK